ncbi:MAG: DEAD/DEAH box helicase family protein [Armatimonadota bacterium]
MDRHVNAISGRLSLRQPQRQALEILARVTEIVPPEKEQDLELALEVIRTEYPTVEDFERDFPSLCFALATGVGKTRLMGAFVAYLHLKHGIRHFFVLAPNLTIYNKLIADFTPSTPKYVLQGIGEFAANPPEIITGDNYESGRGVRDEALRQRRLDFGFEGQVHINIFNISKINSEVRGGRSPRIKRLSEYIGQSYFDYLAGLEDLVLLMDESHRYRASAGVRTINELKPILGLELTATPFVETQGRQVPFENVIYSYPLANAIQDGFVKEPSVATRENFDPEGYTDGELERLKLEDGVAIHEEVKVELDVYARQHGQPLVKPFMLVVARDTAHANALVETIQQDDFFDGRYRDRVITVHSNQRGEEADETVERLLKVEDPDEPTEIVVHVNMLKEGWDVRNLYTIVPLRVANSRTLVEQSIGRGLRLPYGKRVGTPALDRLTIVAHDRFQAIVDEANDPNSIIKKENILLIGKDVAKEKKASVTVQPQIVQRLTQAPSDGDQQAISFPTSGEQEIARLTYEAIKRHESRPRSTDLKLPDVREDLVAEVRAAYVTARAGQGELEGTTEGADLPEVVEKAVELFIQQSIDIPRIVVLPKGTVTTGFNDFDLDTSSVGLQPVEGRLFTQGLHSNERVYLDAGAVSPSEERLENYLVRGLMDFNDICYDEHADLLYKLAGQMVAHLRSYLPDEEAVLNVLVGRQQQLVQLIYSQMQQHVWTSNTEYEAKVSRGFQTLRPNTFSAAAGEKIRPFRAPVEERQYIRGMLFGGFKKCLYPEQKFDSDAERRFAVLIEDDPEVLKWFKPARGQFQIYYHHDQAYEPDFVVETNDAKYLCEPKRADQMQDEEVQAKARAAVRWCEHATAHEMAHSGKPWRYLLIPHDAIQSSMTLKGMAAAYAVNP